MAAVSATALRLGSALVDRIPEDLRDPTWRLRDRVALAACWLTGFSLLAIAGLILLWLFLKGADQLSVPLLTTDPLPNFEQINSGGIATPIVGSLLLTLIGALVALPLGVATAVWLVEYGRPAPLARAVESCVEVVAGTPSIVLAIFGLAIFTQEGLGFLSFKDESGGVFGRSFLVAGLVMSLLALPLIVGATREGLRAIPSQTREASYALGKSKIATIRKVLIPAARPSIATGTILGMGRIIGDTAIVVILLGASLSMSVEQYLHPANWLETARGTGSTLTSYVYNASPAGEGNSPDKAYAAGFVLMMIVVCLNFVVGKFAQKGDANWKR